MPKPLTVWITTNCGNFFKKWEYQTTWPTSWEICKQVRKKQLELDLKWGKGVCQGWMLSPCLFNLYAEYIMRNAGLEEAQAGIKISGRNINNLRYSDDRKWRRTKEPLDESERGEWKSWFKAQHWEMFMASGLITSWQIDGETVETLTDFIFLDSKITADGDCSHEIKRCLLFVRKVMINLGGILKRRLITMSTKVCLVKTIVFLVVMYGCES